MLLRGYAPKRHCSLDWLMRWTITKTTRHWKNGPEGRPSGQDGFGYFTHMPIPQISWHEQRNFNLTLAQAVSSWRAFMLMDCDLWMQWGDRCAVSSRWLACLHWSVNVARYDSAELFVAWRNKDQTYCLFSSILHYWQFVQLTSFLLTVPAQPCYGVFLF
jgi:hypothetical protein